jgi:bifunctional non-homologous end joining protein LigD
VSCVQWISAGQVSFPIIGFVPETAGIAALYLGKKEGKEITYVGKVGTGFNRKTSGEIRKRLNEIIVPKAMLSKPIRKPKATWVKPKYFAAVDYRDITSEGYLRRCRRTPRQGQSLS